MNFEYVFLDHRFIKIKNHCTNKKDTGELYVSGMFKKILVISTIVLLVPLTLSLSDVVLSISNIHLGLSTLLFSYIVNVLVAAFPSVEVVRPHILAVIANIPAVIGVLFIWLGFRKYINLRYFKKEEVLGKEVFDADARRVGYVKDWTYTPGERQRCVAIVVAEKKEGDEVGVIPIDEIDRIGEFILLKKGMGTLIPEKKLEEALIKE